MITLGRTPLDEWSALGRDLYLTTHTLTRDRHPCPRRDSNPQSQQASGRRPTPYTARHWRYSFHFKPESEYTCSMYNSITSTDAIRTCAHTAWVCRSFVINFFLDLTGYNYANALELLNLDILQDRRLQLDSILVINVFLGGREFPKFVHFYRDHQSSTSQSDPRYFNVLRRLLL